MRNKRNAWIRLGLFGALLLTIALVATLAGFRPSPERVREYGDGFGILGPILFVPLSTALGCLLVPGPILAGAAGLLFGTALGVPVALTAAVCTAVAELLIARYVAGREVAEVLPERARRIDGYLEQRGFWAVVYIRLAPGIPYHFVNYGAGLTHLRVRDMALGTAVGALPRTFAYVALGGSLDDLGSPEGIAALVLLVGTALVGLYLNRGEVARGLSSLRSRMTYFRFTRIYSLIEATLFVSLLVVWLGELSPELKTVLGWAHGFGWIGLCLIVYVGCLRKVFPWPLLAATVSPLGPIASSIGIEWIRRRERRSAIT